MTLSEDQVANAQQVFGDVDGVVAVLRTDDYPD